MLNYVEFLDLIFIFLQNPMDTEIASNCLQDVEGVASTNKPNTFDYFISLILLVYSLEGGSINEPCLAKFHLRMKINLGRVAFL